jgi:hypothetical protein
LTSGGDDAELQAFKENMKGRFLMSDQGTFFYYLGIEVH